MPRSARNGQVRQNFPETQQEAMKIARANQKPGQTKEQTQLIAQGSRRA